MNNHIIGRGTDHCRKPVIAEEVRSGPSFRDDIATNSIKLRCAHARSHRGPDAFMHLSNDSTRLAHTAKFRRGSPRHGCQRTLSGSAGNDSGIDGGEQALGDLIGCAETVNRNKETSFAVPIDGGLCLCGIGVQTFGDRLGGVVGALDNR